MSEMYNHKVVEKAWQKVWDDEKAFVVENDFTKPKFYALVEFGICHDNIVGMTKRRHFGNNLNLSEFAIIYYVSHLLLSNIGAVTVVGMDRILFPRKGFFLNSVGLKWAFIYLGAKFNPFFIDCRMLFVLHGSADFDYQRIIFVV